MRTPQQIVEAEVFASVSTLVATLAAGAYLDTDPLVRRDHGADTAIRNLFAQAAELAAPMDDWEETLIQNGWEKVGDNWRHIADIGDEPLSLDDAMIESGIDDPYQREVYEHWIVSDWLADKLEAKGEKVDRDFAGLTVWARTTTGQAIYADWLFEEIARESDA